MATCLCADRGYVRALEEDDFGFPDKVVTLSELADAILGRCRAAAPLRVRLCLVPDRSGQVAPLGRDPGDSRVGDRQARPGPLTG
jgi:hypothetical protein